jgi:hypothetical protein
MMTPSAWGRLLFPAAWAINLLLALGWSHWVMPPRRNAWLAVPVGALAVLALLTPFLVIRPAFQKPALIHPDAVPVAARRAPVYHGALARSLGGMIEPAVAHPGDTVWVTIYWAVMERPDRDYTVFVHLVDTNGDKVAQSDGQPVNGAWPTSAWEPGSPVVDRHRLAIPSDTAPGTYFLQAGMYLLASGERLPVAGLNDRVQDNAMTLGTAEVTHE